MRKETTVTSGKLAVSAAALVLVAAVSCNSKPRQDRTGHDHGSHDHSTGGAASGDAAATAPATRDYADAVAQLRAQMASLDAILKSGDYDGVHKDSVAIGKIGQSIGALAAAKGSPVPKVKVTEVTAEGQELAAAARSFHHAAHEPDLPKVNEHYAHMRKLIDGLALHVPKP